MPQLALRLLSRLNATLGGRLHRFVQRRRAMGALSVVGFCGFGSPRQAFLEGRVLRPRHVVAPAATNRRWTNFQNSVRRFSSREVEGAQITGVLAGVTAHAVTNSEGYFRLEFHFPSPPADGWHSAELQLPGRGVHSTSPVRIVADAEFGVISDLDDTVIVTGVTRAWRMALTVLFGNAHTRLPFPGVAALYRALVHGPHGTSNNPVFYVSSSPWNLFDFLWSFLEFRGVPLGPLFLRDWGWHTLRAQHGTHKLEAITRLFEWYPALKFVLIGDSGEHDPEIYREVVQRFPNRVLAVYIRDVSPATRDSQLEALRAELRANRVDLVLAGDTLHAAHHAYALGLIGTEGVREVGKDT